MSFRNMGLESTTFMVLGHSQEANSPEIILTGGANLKRHLCPLATRGNFMLGKGKAEVPVSARWGSLSSRKRLQDADILQDRVSIEIDVSDCWDPILTRIVQLCVSLVLCLHLNLMPASQNLSLFFLPMGPGWLNLFLCFSVLLG